MNQQPRSQLYHIEVENFYIENHWTFPNIWATLVSLALLTHLLFIKLDAPFLSFTETLWNLFVRTMPTSLVYRLCSTAERLPGGTITSINAPMQQAEKSELLRSTLGLGTGQSIMARGRRRHTNAPKGLGNWDNSCYQNSMLQALAALPSVQVFLNEVESKLGAAPSTSTISALKDLVTELNNAEADAAYLWTPNKLKSMSSWQQQDAQEYFSKLLDALESDIKNVSKANFATTTCDLGFLGRSDMGTESGSSVSIQCVSDVDKNNQARAIVFNRPSERKSVSSPLEGLLAQRVGCTECGHTDGLSLIPFNCMTLPLGSASQYGIEDCLDEFTGLEYIEGVECPKCSLLYVQSQLRRLLGRFEMSNDPQGTDKYGENSANREDVVARLQAVEQALRDQDFSETTLKNRCQIPSHLRKCSKKSKQVALLRAPKCLVMHVNRSLFDEYTGAQLKNYADVDFPQAFDPSPWIVGGESSHAQSEADTDSPQWTTNPNESMLPVRDKQTQTENSCYKLKAVVTHYGRHENGHYICYRQSPVPDEEDKDDNMEDSSTSGDENLSQKWWRISDEDVNLVSMESVMSQKGVFMLFYERSDDVLSLSPSNDNVPQGTGLEQFEATADSDGSPDLKPDADSPRVDGVQEDNLRSHETSSEPERVTAGGDNILDSDPLLCDDFDATMTDAENDTNECASSEESQRQLSPTNMRTATPAHPNSEDQAHIASAQVVAPI